MVKKQTEVPEEGRNKARRSEVLGHSPEALNPTALRQNRLAQQHRASAALESLSRLIEFPGMVPTSSQTRTHIPTSPSTQQQRKLGHFWVQMLCRKSHEEEKELLRRKSGICWKYPTPKGHQLLCQTKVLSQTCSSSQTPGTTVASLFQLKHVFVHGEQGMVA